MYFLKLFMSFH